MIAKELESMLKDAAAEMGRDLQADWDAVRQYAAERILYLSTIVGEPGYEMAVRAERDSIALEAGINVVDAMDAADQRLVGIIQGVIGIGAKAI